MLATTIQITNNPPHTTHTNKQQAAGRLRRQPPPNQGSRRSHGVEREPDSVLICIKHLCPTQNAPTPTTHNPGSKHMQAQENNPTHQPKGHHATSSQSPIPPSTTPPAKTVRPWASGVTNFRDVTGGVYKARERIHRSVADLRLLATPPSWGRVADPNPN